MNPYRQAISRFAGTRTGAGTLRVVLPPLDRLVLRVSRGRFNFANHVIPTLVLTTTGRTSGLPREQQLCYVRDGGDLVVVGTNWGQAHHPAWTSNLLADPRAQVLVDGRRSPVTASLVPESDWERLYQRFEAMAANYRSYRVWTGDRVPRLFRLTP